VNGRKLSRGKYLITLRAFDKHRRKVIALSQPVVITIR